MVLLISYILSALVCAALSPSFGTVSAKGISDRRNKFLDVTKGSKSRLAGSSGGGGVQPNLGVNNITFSNPAASGEFYLSPSLARSS